MFKALNDIPDVDLMLDEPLARFTAARLGGPADAVARVHKRQALIKTVQWARTQSIPWFIIGGGANILVSDKGVRGLVILNNTKHTVINNDGHVQSDSGESLISLARRCMKRGLAGLEWAVSVPGTVGGAVVNNAGAHGSDMTHNLQSVTLIDFYDRAEPQVWPAEKMQYDYRFSVLKGKREQYLVLGTYLHLEPGHEPEELLERANSFIAHRKRTQPPGASLGSMFKNPPDDYAGRLIDVAGLKGYQIGGVQVSPVHANFFVNVEQATAGDYAALIAHVQATVYKQTGVSLELEIEMVGEDF